MYVCAAQMYEYYMYTECMSPTLNKSLAMQHTKCCNVVKIYNEIKLVAVASDRTDTHTHTPRTVQAVHVHVP